MSLSGVPWLKSGKEFRIKTTVKAEFREVATLDLPVESEKSHEKHTNLEKPPCQGEDNTTLNQHLYV